MEEKPGEGKATSDSAMKGPSTASTDSQSSSYSSNNIKSSDARPRRRVVFRPYVERSTRTREDGASDASGQQDVGEGDTSSKSAEEFARKQLWVKKWVLFMNGGACGSLYVIFIRSTWL